MFRHTLIVICLGARILPTSVGQKESDGISSSEIPTYNLTLSTFGTDGVEQENDAESNCETIDNKNIATARSGVRYVERLWKQMRYYMEGTYSLAEFQNIDAAVAILQNVLPCVKFRSIIAAPPDSEPYVVLKRGQGCKSSWIGKLGTRQEIILDSFCLKQVRTILHQFLHALGVAHEHNRLDRDDYIDIHWDNIKDDSKANFEKVDPAEFSTYGVAYNPHSIMHYGLYIGSANGQPTISLKKDVTFAPNQPVSLGSFENTGLQASDIDKIRKIYNCGGF